jgi:hypothetical protein
MYLIERKQETGNSLETQAGERGEKNYEIGGGDSLPAVPGRSAAVC